MKTFFLGALFAWVLILATVYGFDSSLTAEGFVVQGYLGAILPPSWVLMGFLIRHFLRK